jgi:two-component system NarL family response regulator
MASTKPIRVLIADDHPVVREGLRALVARRPDMDVVAEAATGREAVDGFFRHRPDVALIDLRMPDLDGVDALVAIRQREPSARVVVLTSFGGDDDVYRALRAGAKAYLMKYTPREDLIACIRAVHAGESWISPHVAAKLTARLGSRELTPREREVLHLIVAGRSNKEISAALRLAEGTVKAHVNRILAKLEVSSRAAAISVALRRGIAKLDDG